MNEAVKEKYHSSSISFYQQQWIICALWSIVEVGFAVFGWLCLTSWLNFLTTNSSIRPSIPSTNHGGTQRLFIWSVESLRKVSSIEWSGWNLIPPLTGIDGLPLEPISWPTYQPSQELYDHRLNTLFHSMVNAQPYSVSVEWEWVFNRCSYVGSEARRNAELSIWTRLWVTNVGSWLTFNAWYG